MGGLVKALFGSPKPAPLPPLPLPVAAKADGEDEARRAEILARRRRGRVSTVATSARGIFALGQLGPERKRLLGE